MDMETDVNTIVITSVLKATVRLAQYLPETKLEEYLATTSEGKFVGENNTFHI
jgi:hypothetical protein